MEPSQNIIPYPYAAPMAVKARRKSLAPETEDVAVSLEHIYAAMQFAGQLVADAEREHWGIFQDQMTEATGTRPAAFASEPYLESEMIAAQLSFVRRMERLFDRIEGYLPLANKARFNPREPFLPQIESRVAAETTNLKRELQQALDKRRQRNAGVTNYIWVTVGDNRVRESHQALADGVYSWAEVSPEGHPGEPSGCRCGAMPTAQGMDEGEDGADEIDEFEVAGWGIVIKAIIKRTLARKEAARRAARAAARIKKPKDILQPNGKPIGKRGKRDAIRIMKGGEEAAKQLFRRLTKDGKLENRTNYPGRGVRLKNGDWIGYRAKSKSGPPSIDLDVKGISFTKIKFPK